jgi:hypothetical protein
MRVLALRISRFLKLSKSYPRMGMVGRLFVRSEQNRSFLTSESSWSFMSIRGRLDAFSSSELFEDLDSSVDLFNVNGEPVYSLMEDSPRIWVLSISSLPQEEQVRMLLLRATK